ncbi:MAG: hypothetical protein AVO35_03065 [Candidatus Aegiribacteria sp. MLS_C]|nr:MAG: hypothetical protein AVO35_03065 [Candidatus Aegiribacteria sp. MLS_C]
MPEHEKTELSELALRFIRYAGIDTASDGSSDTSPSTAVQMDFLMMLRDELIGMGMEGVELDPAGTLYAGLPGGGSGETVVGLLAHVDTSPEAPGRGVSPRVHRNWDGGPIVLEGGTVIDPSDTERMSDYVGGTIITSDGTTLLGADDKAGVAVIMEACRILMEDPGIPRPPVRVAFTTDEEIGRGMDGFDTSKFGAELAYTVDGGPVGKVDTQTFNACSAVFAIKGREVHPGSAKGQMVNAVRIASDLVSTLMHEEMPENSQGTEGYTYPMSISGTTGEAALRLILRDFTEEGMKRRLEYLDALREFMVLRYPVAGIDLKTSRQYSNPAEVLKKDPRAVEYAMRGTMEAGIRPQETAIRGGTDGSRLSFMGVPTVNLPTGGELFHSRREWVAEEGLEQSLATLMATLRTWGVEQRRSSGPI